MASKIINKFEEADAETLELLKGISNTNITIDLFNKLKEQILTGKLKPGIGLPSELQLCEYMGVGRSTVREALRVLSTMGLITRTKRGTFVNERLNVNEILPFPEILRKVQRKDVLEYRALLETEIAALAAERATNEDIKNLSDTLGLMRRVSHNVIALTRADKMFHMQLAGASQNKVFLNTSEMIGNVIEDLILDAFVLDEEIRIRAIKYHERIFDAVKSENPKLARKAMREHLVDVAGVVYD